MKAPEIILYNGAITTLDEHHPEGTAVAVSGGRITATGGDELLASADGSTHKIDLKKHRVIPGLNDSHIHVIRGGLNFNMELRWDGVPSLSDALAMLREQARRTPPPQWVRVIGGWTEFPFAERRMPTLEEINNVAPDTPVFVLHLYDRAFVNAAAGLRVLGYNPGSPQPTRGGNREGSATQMKKNSFALRLGGTHALNACIATGGNMGKYPSVPLATRSNTTTQ